MPCRETGGAFFGAKMLKRLLQLGTFLALTAWCVPAWAATQDFTTWTETDTTRLSQTADRSTFTGVQRDEDIYLSNDFGVDNFDKDDDLVFNFHAQITSTANSALVTLVGLSNDLDDLKGLIDNNKDWIGVYFFDNAGTMEFNIGEVNAGVFGNTATTGSYSTSTTYYFTLYRRMTGEFGPGRLLLYIFSDSGRTVLIEKVQRILPFNTVRQHFRYGFAPQSYNSSTTEAVSGWVDSLDIAATLPAFATGLTLLTSYVAPLGPPFQQHLLYSGRYFYAFGYTGNGTTTEALQVAYAYDFDMVFGAEHAFPNLPAGKRGYYTAVAANWLQTWYAPMGFTTDTGANIATPEAVMMGKTNGNLGSSTVVVDDTAMDRMQWPVVTIDGQRKAVLSGRDAGTNTQVIYQRAAGGANRFSVDGWETKVVVKSGLTASQNNIQTFAYESGDMGHVISEGREGATLSYVHSTYNASDDTYTEETAQTIGTDLAWEWAFRAFPLRNNKLLVVWREYDSGAPGTYNTLRYRVRSAGSSGTWGTAGDAVTDVNGTANNQAYFTGTVNAGKAEEAVLFYYDGTNMVETTWDGSSWSTKATLISSPTVSGNWISAPYVSVDKTAVSWPDATAGGIQVAPFDLTTTQESSDGTLASLSGVPIQATDDFNVQMVTDPNGSGKSLVAWMGRDHRMWSRLRDLSTGSWLGPEVPIMHKEYDDLHNTARIDAGDDGKVVANYGGRSGPQDEAPVLKESSLTLANMTSAPRDWVDIRPSLTYDGNDGHRGYKWGFRDRLGVTYSFYNYINTTASPNQYLTGVIERRGGSWSSEVQIVNYDDPETTSTANRNYLYSLVGGNESGNWTITNVVDDGATATITVDDATDLVDGMVVQVTGTGTALDDTAAPISGLSGNDFTYPKDPAGTSSTGSVDEQESIHFIWGYRDQSVIPVISQGSVLQGEVNHAKVIPQGDGTFKVYEADGTLFTLPMHLTNKENLYEYNTNKKTITAISIANPTVVTSVGHGLSSGNHFLDATDSTPDIDGKQNITVTGVDTFTVPVNVTGAGTAGTVSDQWEWSRLGGTLWLADDGGTIRPVVVIPMMDSASPYDPTRITALEWDGSVWNSTDVDTSSIPEIITMQLVEDGAGDLVLATVNDYGGDSEIVRFKSSDHGTTWAAQERLTTSDFDNLQPLLSPGYNGNTNLLWHQAVSRLHSEVLFDTLAKTAAPGIPYWWLASMDDHRLDEIERREYVPLPEHELEFVR